MLRAAMPGGMADEPVEPGSLNAKDRSFWNGFVGYVQSKGLKGSPDLDKRSLNLSKKLFSEYSEANKGTYNYDTFIPQVQQHISDYRTKAIEHINAGKSGIAGYTGDPKDYDFDKEFMSGLSAVDGWAGSKTTAWRFPQENMEVTDVKGNKIKQLPNQIFKEISMVPMMNATNKIKK